MYIYKKKKRQTFHKDGQTFCHDVNESDEGTIINLICDSQEKSLWMITMCIKVASMCMVVILKYQWKMYVYRKRFEHKHSIKKEKQSTIIDKSLM